MALLPSVDLLDRGPRLKRLVVSVLAGLAAGAVAYLIACALVKPDGYEKHVQVGRNIGAGGFVMWVTIIAAAVVFAIAIAAQTYLAKKAYRETRGMPEAKVP